MIVALYSSRTAGYPICLAVVEASSTLLAPAVGTVGMPYAAMGRFDSRG